MLLYPTFAYSDSNSGTLNNVHEILDYMKKKQLSEVVVVTSPYHEKRVKSLFDKFALKNGNISVSFLHVKDSEILTAPYRRYVSLIVHESGAIAVDWARYGLLTRMSTMKTGKPKQLSRGKADILPWHCSRAARRLEARRSNLVPDGLVA